jgi:hypothetical protein
VLDKYELYGIDTVTTSAGTKSIYPSKLNGVIGLAPVCGDNACPPENLID